MKWQERSLVRKYAQAYMRALRERLTAESVKDLEAFTAYYTEHKEKFFYVHMVLLALHIKTDLLLKAADQFGVRELIQPLVLLLAQHHRLGLLPLVLHELIALYGEIHGMVKVQIESAQPLHEQEEEIIKNFLERLTGKKVQALLKVNPQLIAGIRAQSATFLWERSVAQQLRKLKHSLGEGIS